MAAVSVEWARFTPSKRGGAAWEYMIMGERPAGAQPENNVYTILVMIAALLVVGATVYLAVRCQQLFGTWNPL